MAEYGIVYVDEVDKLAEPAGSLRAERSGVNTRDVQSALLKLMEDAEVPLTPVASRLLLGRHQDCRHQECQGPPDHHRQFPKNHSLHRKFPTLPRLLPTLAPRSRLLPSRRQPPRHNSLHGQHWWADNHLHMMIQPAK